MKEEHTKHQKARGHTHHLQEVGFAAGDGPHLEKVPGIRTELELAWLWGNAVHQAEHAERQIFEASGK